MKRVTFVLFMLFVCGNIHSQVISGTVFDAISQLTISSAEIVITNQSSGSVDTVYSDYSGNWVFNLNPQSQRQNNPIPYSYQLGQNYPNPFNPGTKIPFSVSEAGEVSVIVHDITGRVVDQSRSYLYPGRYVIDWKSKGSAGMYFYTIKTRDFKATRKMIQLDGGQGRGLGEIHPVSLSEGKLAKQTEIPVTITVSRFSYIPDTLSLEIDGDEQIITYLTSIHHQATMTDLHNDILEKMLVDTSYHLGEWHSYNHTDIPRLIQGDVDIQLFVAWVSPYDYPDNPFQIAMNMASIFQTEIAANQATIGQARTAQEADSLNSADKIAAVFVVEGGHAIENSLDNLIALYHAGMRYLTITWNNSTDWAISAKDPLSETVGLSDFGRDVIHCLDSLGVIIDVSHTGIKTIQDILETTQNPIIASHSGARALRDHYRNLYDYQIEDIAATGGVIGVVFYPPFLSYNSSSVTINTVLDHIDYIVNLVGVDYVSIGSDFDGIGSTPIGLEDVTKFPALTMGLLQRGYTREEVYKILGDNFNRVFQQVCGVPPGRDK